MASGNVKAFTDANFAQDVLKSSVPVLVDFWAEWCMPCRMLTPTIEAVADAFAGRAVVGKLNTDDGQETSIKYGINMIPTVIIFKGGEPVKKFIGVASRDDISKALELALAN
ncbi:MAG: thioredoxin [Phycisphaerales bacterium]|nr:thioredoxin [Phycisphaerales bacterium]